MSEKKQHGGKRSGAGRKPAPEPAKKIVMSLRLTPEQKAWLDRQGARCAARTIRALIDAAIS